MQTSKIGLEGMSGLDCHVIYKQYINGTTRTENANTFPVKLGVEKTRIK